MLFESTIGVWRPRSSSATAPEILEYVFATENRGDVGARDCVGAVQPEVPLIAVSFFGFGARIRVPI